MRPHDILTNEQLAELSKTSTKFYVTDGGHAITEPMSHADIVAKFGSIKELEANGFRLVKA